MTNFSSIERNYYTPPSNDWWDRFVDYCDENNLDTDSEDFEEWCEEQTERAEEAAAERAMEYAMEDRFYPEFD